MPGKIEDASYARLLAMLILSVIAFPILAEVVSLAEVAGAPSRPDDVFSIQEQLIAAKKASPVKDDASVKLGGSSDLPENLALDGTPATSGPGTWISARFSAELCSQKGLS